MDKKSYRIRKLVDEIKLAELVQFVEQSLTVGKSCIAMSLFLFSITILAFDASSAEAYGRIRAELVRKYVALIFHAVAVVQAPVNFL